MGQRQPSKIILFQNGNSIILDEDGNQMLTLDKGWFCHFLEYLEGKGINVTSGDLQISLVSDSKEERVFRPFRTSSGEINWEVYRRT